MSKAKPPRIYEIYYSPNQFEVVHYLTVIGNLSLRNFLKTTLTIPSLKAMKFYAKTPDNQIISLSKWDNFSSYPANWPESELNNQ